MTTEYQIERIANNLEYIKDALKRIANALEQQQSASPGPATGPNLQRSLAQYSDFDWPSIDAALVARDRHGATIVRWQGSEWTRRRHTDYGNEVWFSRYVGMDEDQSKIYARLITFAERAPVKPLPAEITTTLPAADVVTENRAQVAAGVTTTTPEPPTTPSTLDEYFPR